MGNLECDQVRKSVVYETKDIYVCSVCVCLFVCPFVCVCVCTLFLSITFYVYVVAPIIGHVGDGNFHCFIVLDPNDDDEVKRAREFGLRLGRSDK